MSLPHWWSPGFSPNFPTLRGCEAFKILGSVATIVWWCQVNVGMAGPLALLTISWLLSLLQMDPWWSMVSNWFPGPCPIIIFRCLSLFLLVSFLRRFSPWLFAWNYHLSFVPSMICHFTKTIWVCLKKGYTVYPQICDLVVMKQKKKIGYHKYFQTNPYFISVPITGETYLGTVGDPGRYGRLGEQWRGTELEQWIAWG